VSAGATVAAQYGTGNPLAAYRDTRTMGLSGWWSWLQDPLRDWQSEGRTMAAFAWNLVQTDPHARALLRARLQLTHGAQGLRFRSTYQLDDNASSSVREREIQRRINARLAMTFEGFNLDAGGQLTRVQSEKLLDASKVVAGDGFAVRCWNPDRPEADFATCWRIVDAGRVCNPNGIGDWDPAPRPDIGDAPPVGHVLWQGIEVDPDRRPVALWIEIPDRKGGFGNSEWQRVPYHDKQGRRSVIHRFTPIRPGQLRGFSEFGALFQVCKQLKGTNEAHVIGKRAQASMPIFLRSSDPTITAAFQRAHAVAGPNTPVTPGLMQFIGEDGDVIMSQVSYNGSDYEAHVNVQVRAMAAAWGIPYEVVLAVLGKASLASARAQLDQAERTASEWQDEHIQQVSRAIDGSYLSEEIARRRLTIRSVRKGLAGRYLRPRTFSTDRYKDAQAAGMELGQGRDPAEVFARYYGTDFESEIRGAKQAQELADEIGFPLNYVAAAGNTAPVEVPADEIEPDEEEAA
jgi:capsid protein